MSTTESTNVDGPISGCRPADIDPVVVDGADLESTAPEYLRDLKAELSRRGYQPAALAVTACFAEDCSLATQEEADRLRGFVRAAAFLGAGRIEIAVDDVAEPAKVDPALSALSERAAREGVTLRITGDAEIAG
ncbi:hypothetical protein [Halopenitus sp. POP-27]|uniref:hypothetical protein n=1 Tax=Halopenitus sp. POP-27 TaxID=2994425 RepID=UPI0024683F7C|nr:hypothetical protein [Halopenitus sp. POP-27]